MPLDWQVFDVKFMRGLDTRTQPKFVLPSKWRALNNLTLAADNTPRRRDGIASLISGENGNGLATRNNELLVVNGSTVDSVSLATSPVSAQARSGQLGYVGLAKQEVEPANGFNDSPDMATGGGLTAFIWRMQPTTGAVNAIKLTVIDESTGTRLINGLTLKSGANYLSPRIAYSNGAFFCFYLDPGANLFCRVVEVSAPTAVGPEVAIVNNANLTIFSFDAVAFDDAAASSVMVVYTWLDGVHSLRGLQVVRTGNNPNSGLGPVNLMTEAAVPEATIVGIGCAAFSATRIMSYAMTASMVPAPSDGVWATVSDDTFTVSFPETQIDTTYAATIRPASDTGNHLTATLVGADLQLFYDNVNDIGVNGVSEMRTGTFNTLLQVISPVRNLINSFTYGVAATDATGPQGPFIAGKAFTTAAGDVLLPCAMYDLFPLTGPTVTAAEQNVVVLLDGTTGKMVARGIYGSYGSSETAFTTFPTACSVAATLTPSVGAEVAATLSPTAASGSPQFESIDTTSPAWTTGETMTGGTSGATGIADAPTGSVGNARLFLRSVVGTFISGEAITGNMGFSGTAISSQQAVVLVSPVQSAVSALAAGLLVIGSSSKATATLTGISLLSQAPLVYCLFISGVNGAFVNNEQLYELESNAPNTFSIMVPERVLSIANNQNVSLAGMSRVLLVPNNSIAPIKTQLGEVTYFAGGTLSAYDGSVITEQCFPVFPEGINVTHSAGGAVDNGTHQVVAVYEWMDTAGQRHQSAPSLAVSAVAGGGNNTFDAKVPTTQLSQKPGITIVIYMTLANGLAFYRVTSVAAPVANSTSVAYVSITISVTDSTISGNELLYTQPNQAGAPLPSFAPGPMTALAAAHNRLFFNVSDSPNAFGYSQLYTNNVGLQFNDKLSGLVDQSGGGIVGFSPLDEKIIILCLKKLFVVYGSGPSPSGDFNNYSEPQEIHSDVGCVEARSILKMPHGIIFKSQKGWYMLGRDLTVAYIGEGVAAYDGNQVSSAVLLEDRQECRFASSSGTQLVYAYDLTGEDGVGQWSTFSVSGEEPYRIADAIWWSADGLTGRYVSVSLTRGLNADNPGVYADSQGGLIARGFNWMARTAWLKLASVDGFQRVRWLYLTATADSQPSTTLTIDVDFDDAYDGAAPGSYSLPVLLGNIPFTPGMPIDLRTKLHRQKCKSVAFTFTEGAFSPDATPLNGIQALTLQVGIKKGTNKLPAAQSVG